MGAEMRSNFSRKNFLRICSGVFAGGILSPFDAAADDAGNGYITFTEDVALSIAQGFADSAYPDSHVTAMGPIPIQNHQGALIGYSVSYIDRSGRPNGYIILNTECEGLIDRYIVKPGVMDIASALLNRKQTTRQYSDDCNAVLVALDSFDFGLIDLDAQMLYTRDDVCELNSSGSLSISLLNDSWSDTMISYDDAFYTNYSILTEQYAGEIICVSEAAVESAIQKYACAVHALYCIASSIPNANRTGYLISNPYGEWDEYERLWRYTSTTVSKIEGGITFGSTTTGNVGPAFSQYCKYKGVTAGYTYKDNPVFSDFMNNVDSNQFSIVHASIDTDEGEVGHAMAVFGYSKIQRVGSNVATLCLAVFDGWNDVVMLNYSFPRYNYLSATLLSHPR